jgi:hypothetical protein
VRARSGKCCRLRTFAMVRERRRSCIFSATRWQCERPRQTTDRRLAETPCGTDLTRLFRGSRPNQIRCPGAEWILIAGVLSSAADCATATSTRNTAASLASCDFQGNPKGTLRKRWARHSFLNAPHCRALPGERASSAPSVCATLHSAFSALGSSPKTMIERVVSTLHCAAGSIAMFLKRSSTSILGC